MSQPPFALQHHPIAPHEPNTSLFEWDPPYQPRKRNQYNPSPTPGQVLYVAFGGRFGLEYYGTNNRGSPPRRSNDVYEDFYKSRNQNHNYQSRDNYNHRGHRSSSSSSSSSDWGGFYPYMMVLGAVACISQRFFGISPYQAIFLVTTLMGRRGGRVDPRRRYGGWGGMGGGGGGFGRNYNFRHRRGGMWGR